MNAETVNKILNITESYKMPETLERHLFNCNIKEKLFDEFMNVGEPLDHDWFTEYFQNEHGDRDRLKQDYTPDCICEVAMITSKPRGLVADICAGTGGLTLKAWQNGAKDFYCLEFSARVIPILLMNLSIRNMKAIVVHGDALTRETFCAWKLTPTEKYSDIEEIQDKEHIQDIKVDTVIMNPPYSMSWSGTRGFFGYETPPKSKCDYAFVLDGLERLNEHGTLTAILPHGVFFRGSKEGKVRQKLIENNLYDTIIGMPDKLFLNTDIPVAVIKWVKNKDTDEVHFIDADKLCYKDGKKNNMDKKHIDKIKATIELRSNIDKLSYLTDFQEMKENDFNLNIPRYVDTYEPPPEIDIVAVTESLYEIKKEEKRLSTELLSMTRQLRGSTEKKQSELDRIIEIWEEINEL